MTNKKSLDKTEPKKLVTDINVGIKELGWDKEKSKYIPYNQNIYSVIREIFKYVKVDGDFYDVMSVDKIIKKEIQSLIQSTKEEVIEYISFNQGWEETGDKYRKHFGLKTKYDKSKLNSLLKK